MRISDWSSDVCSSDLQHQHECERGDRASGGGGGREGASERPCQLRAELERRDSHRDPRQRHADRQRAVAAGAEARSEARRVGEEWVSTCRSRWSPYHLNTKPETPHNITKPYKK